jgi:hypothetical protein
MPHHVPGQTILDSIFRRGMPYAIAEMEAPSTARHLGMQEPVGLGWFVGQSSAFVVYPPLADRSFLVVDDEGEPKHGRDVSNFKTSPTCLAGMSRQL